MQGKHKFPLISFYLLVRGLGPHLQMIEFLWCQGFRPWAQLPHLKADARSGSVDTGRQAQHHLSDSRFQALLELNSAEPAFSLSTPFSPLSPPPAPPTKIR